MTEGDALTEGIPPQSCAAKASRRHVFACGENGQEAAAMHQKRTSA